MKKIVVLACVAMLAACGQQAEEKKVPAVSLDSENAKLSYAIGMDIGMSLKTLGTELDRAVMTAAINDRLDGVDTKLTQEDANKVKQAYFVKQAEIKAAALKEAGEKNKAEGDAYLAEHAKKEGVTVTESGLHYQVILQGDGAKPTLDDKVTVHYKGTLIDGTEFDSSITRGEPISFPLGGVIPGWQEGVQLMNVGSKYRFVLPPELAYGDRAAGAQIGPNSVLVFEVELLAIVDQKAEAEAAAKAAAVAEAAQVEAAK